MFPRLAVCILFLLVGTSPGHSDCGSIPFLPNVQVFEPNQRAVIAFNGRKEVLVLSTDLRASKPTKVLEVIPFPSEPKVGKADLKTFETAIELINWKLQADAGGGAAGGGGVGGKVKVGKAKPPAGKVTFHKKIGAHDVSVTRVLNPKGFVAWVEDYLRKQKVEEPRIPPALKEVIEEYLDDRFRWFAFNVVELGRTTVTKDAVRYQFDTRKLYYPLRITRAESGSTKVQLILITKDLVRIPDLRPAKVRVLHDPLKISSKEIESIDKGMRALLPRGGVIRIWETEAQLSAFKRDLLTR